MDYDFSNLCADQLEKLVKRLESLKKANLRDYVMALNVINDTAACEQIPEIKVQLDDIFNDVSKSMQIVYTEALNKVQRKLKEYL